MSPLLPIRLRKTDASVPLPLIVPVQTVTLYLITAAQKERLCIFVFSKDAYEVKLGVYTYGVVAREWALHRQKAPSQLHYRPHLCPANARRENYTSPSSKSSSELPILKTRKRESVLLTNIMQNYASAKYSSPCWGATLQKDSFSRARDGLWSTFPDQAAQPVGSYNVKRFPIKLNVYLMVAWIK